mmetsp:Transcript_42859/g.110514  ORF Transcript_42859/g.110514 Transcript_42859/m.110514 type:complete len:315 (+) Transcript_42859:918-1862(+)
MMWKVVELNTTTCRPRPALSYTTFVPSRTYTGAVSFLAVPLTKSHFRSHASPAYPTGHTHPTLPPFFVHVPTPPHSTGLAEVPSTATPSGHVSLQYLVKYGGTHSQVASATPHCLHTPCPPQTLPSGVVGQRIEHSSGIATGMSSPSSTVPACARSLLTSPSLVRLLIRKGVSHTHCIFPSSSSLASPPLPPHHSLPVESEGFKGEGGMVHPASLPSRCVALPFSTAANHLSEDTTPLFFAVLPTNVRWEAKRTPSNGEEEIERSPCAERGPGRYTYRPSSAPLFLPLIAPPSSTAELNTKREEVMFTLCLTPV